MWVGGIGKMSDAGAGPVAWPVDFAPLADVLDQATAELQSFVNWERRDRTGAGRAWKLDPIRDLLDRLGNPHTSFAAVHVAGTKGKGSVCSLVEHGLRKAGLRVGRYASPHVSCFTERLSIEGQPVGRDAFGAALLDALAARRAATSSGSVGEQATWFDLVTAGAFLALRRAGVEWAVIECGLGGRLDSTNVVDGRVAVITNIDLEHTEVLGATRALIAGEKAGILKPGAALVTAVPMHSEAGAVIRVHADKMGCRSTWVRAPDGTSILARNVSLAAAVLDAIGALPQAGTDGRAVSGALLSPDVIEDSALPGRLEWRRLASPLAGAVPAPSARAGTPVILDGAHVPSSLQAVLCDIDAEGRPEGPCVVVVGLHCDKDAAGTIATLRGYADAIITVPVSDDGRSWPTEELAGLAHGMARVVSAEASVAAALRRARWLTQGGGWVLVTGSLYLVGKVRAVLQVQHGGTP